MLFGFRLLEYRHAGYVIPSEISPGPSSSRAGQCLPNFNMLFPLVLTKLSKSELFSCLPKVDHVIKS